MNRRNTLSDAAYANIKQNTAEFSAYSLIATTGRIEGLRNMINVDWGADYNDEEKALIKEALNIRQVILSQNTFKFFRILRKGETNYFFACLMIIRMQPMRLTGITQLLKIGGPRMTNKGLIMSQLNLPSED